MDIDEVYKASTLPTKASDTPETLFQREIAHFRYSKKKKLENSSSLAVQLSDSMVFRKHRSIDPPDEPWIPDGDLMSSKSRGIIQLYSRAMYTWHCTWLWSGRAPVDSARTMYCFVKTRLFTVSNTLRQ